MKAFYVFMCIFLVSIVAAASVIPAAADDGNPPINGNSTWTPIVNSDGSIDTSNLVDLGLQDVPANWMPSVAGIGGVAKYGYISRSSQWDRLHDAHSNDVLFYGCTPGRLVRLKATVSGRYRETARTVLVTLQIWHSSQASLVAIATFLTIPAS